MKEKLKNIEFLRKFVKKMKISMEYNKDKKYFIKYYMDAGFSKEQLEYKIIFYSHSLEKGMTHDNLRPFGEKKVKILLNCETKYLNSNYDLNSTAYQIGYNILKKWSNIYDKNKFDKTSLNNLVDEFLAKNSCKEIEVGSIEYNGKDKIEKLQLNYLDAIKTRHSTRRFKVKNILDSDFEYCVNAAILSPSACNRQMCKVYYIKDLQKKELLSKNIMGLTGFDNKSINLFLITYDVSAFLFYGERNQGFFNCGLFAMNFVNAMHFKGIGSCLLQWSNTTNVENKIKNELNIPKNEKIVVAIAAGYYADNCNVPVSPRKNCKEVSKIV